MNVKVEEIYKNVKRATYSSFNYHNSWEHKLWLSQVIKHLFKEDIPLVVIGTRENDFNVDSELISKLRDNLSTFFIDNSFSILDKWGKSRYSILGKIYPSEDEILKIWKLFEFAAFFQPHENNYYDSLLKSGKSIVDFVALKKIIISGQCDLMLSKTDDDEELAIDFVKEFDFKSLQ